MSDARISGSEPQAASQEEAAAGRRRNRRGRDRRSATRSRDDKLKSPQYLKLTNTIPRTELLSADQLEAIHIASLRVLEETGMDFLHGDAKAMLKAAGADVDPNSDRVRFDREMVLETIKSAPSEFTVHARNPQRNLRFGGNALVFSQIASAPNSSNLDRGRRPGTFDDFVDLVKLAQCYDVVHMIGGYPVEPADIHASIRHLDALSAIVKLTDKVHTQYSLGLERNLDGLEIVRIARGISEDQLATEPSMMSIINTSSPLRLDTVMLEGIIQLSQRNQVIVLTPFTLAGAMAPVTLAGALVQQNAEALAGIAFSQIVNPGAPVIYGGFTSNVDMKSGAPAFGTPEYMKAVLAGGQLARKYGVPYRSSNVCAANAVDSQAAYESVFSLWAVIQSGAHFVKHAAGWMEGGLTASYEKFILDVDFLQMVAEFLQPMRVSDSEIGLDAIESVGPGGHFFGVPHTLERYETAFYAPLISDWRNFESWQQAGSPLSQEHANRLWKQALADYQEPEMDPATREELEAFVARRKQEGGVPTDF